MGGPGCSHGDGDACNGVAFNQKVHVVTDASLLSRDVLSILVLGRRDIHANSTYRGCAYAV